MKVRLLICLIAMSACSSSTEVPDEVPLVDGVVTAFQAARVLIEADVTKCERYWLAIDDDTRILAQTPDGGSRTATVSDIAVGGRAAAWSNDPVAESCPAQGHADVILLRR